MNSFWRCVLVLFGFWVVPVYSLEVERFTVEGVRVDLVTHPDLPMIDLVLSFDAGARHDPAGNEGLAALTRALLTAGTRQRSEEALADAIADLALELSGAAERDRATLRLRMLKEVENEAWDLLAEILTEAAFPEEAFERERQRMIEQLRAALLKPEVLAERAFWASAYPDHPYGQLVTEASLKALTREQVRTFFARHYTRSALSVAAVGAIDRAELSERVARLIAKLPQGAPIEATRCRIPRRDPHRVHLPHASTQTHWVVGTALICRHDPDYFPLLVGNWILGGGGFSSRLMQEVREARGLAYSVHSALEPLADAGPIAIRLQSRGRHRSDLEALLRETLARFLAEGPGEEELYLAQRALADGWGLRLDSNRKIAEWLSIVNFYDLAPDWLARVPDEIRAVSRQVVQEALARRLPLDVWVWVSAGGESDQPSQ